jgi:hypothetical protein
VQHQMSDMFEDTDWLLGFIEENSKRLGAAYDAIAGLHTVSMTVILHRPVASDRADGCHSGNTCGMAMYQLAAVRHLRD